MKRRNFLQSAATLGPALMMGQSIPLAHDPIERMTAGKSPGLVVCQAGFRPDAKKRVYVRQKDVTSIQLEETDSGFRQTFPLDQEMRGDFTEVTRAGTYRIRAGRELSEPFVIQADAWRRHLPLVVSYHRAQRCGVEVPGVHPACHLDDARRRDNGEHVDTTGGWHDAGDLRKWMTNTMMNAYGLFGIVRNMGAQWDSQGLGPLDEELRWGNVYFLKMQDSDGQVWADVAGGLNGDNSDNHWTDNKVGTSDDRYLNTRKGGSVQPMFTALQAMYSAHFRSDESFSGRCLEAARKCWQANRHDGDTEEMAWWVLAAVELYRATNEDEFLVVGRHMARRLVTLQRRQDSGLSGYWPMSSKWDEPYKLPVHAALPAFVLLEAARAFPPGHDWLEAVKLHIEGYVEPMISKSVYGVVPFGVFKGTPTDELYRPLQGELTYRSFMPVRKQYWWVGMNGPMLSYALMLATAARDMGQNRWRDLAYRQMEWVFGANPFGVSTAIGIGSRCATAYSKFVGQIKGGIVAGVCGNAHDEPVMDMGRTPTWRSNEYWSPYVGYFEWTQSVLEGG